MTVDLWQRTREEGFKASQGKPRPAEASKAQGKRQRRLQLPPPPCPLLAFVPARPSFPLCPVSASFPLSHPCGFLNSSLHCSLLYPVWLPLLSPTLLLPRSPASSPLAPNRAQPPCRPTLRSCTRCLLHTHAARPAHYCRQFLRAPCAVSGRASRPNTGLPRRRDFAVALCQPRAPPVIPLPGAHLIFTLRQRADSRPPGADHQQGLHRRPEPRTAPW